MPTQLRVGWLYTMAGHAVSITATGSGGSVEGLDSGVLRLRFGLLTIAADVWEGFAVPAAIALVAGIVGGWSTSASWQRPTSRAVRAGGRAFLWASVLSFVGLLVFASLRPEGLERYSVEVWSQGPQRATLYLGHQGLVAPNQAMWVLAPSMGGCVSVRAEGAARDLVCLDRIPRATDPATWLLSELGRVDGPSPTAPMPVTAWLFVAVPVSAIVLGFRGLGRTGATIPRAIGRGVLGGLVFAVLVTVASLASALWLSVTDGDVTRLVVLGPDPVTTGLLATAWGVVGGAAVSAATPVWRRFSRRARPR